MKLASLFAAVVVGSSVLVGCSESPTCDDVDDLTEQLADMSPEDSDYNDVVEDLKLAQADCNA